MSVAARLAGTIEDTGWSSVGSLPEADPGIAGVVGLAFQGLAG